MALGLLSFLKKILPDTAGDPPSSNIHLCTLMSPMTALEMAISLPPPWTAPAILLSS